jgi:integrase
MQQSGKNRLFADIKPGKDGYYSHNFSKYFSRLLKAIGIKTKKHSFHSFRHNFGEALDRADVQFLIREMLMGHADDTTAGRYRNPDAHVPTLYSAISRVKFEADLSHLMPMKT